MNGLLPIRNNNVPNEKLHHIGMQNVIIGIKIQENNESKSMLYSRIQSNQDEIDQARLTCSNEHELRIINALQTNLNDLKKSMSSCHYVL